MCIVDVCLVLMHGYGHVMLAGVVSVKGNSRITNSRGSLLFSSSIDSGAQMHPLSHIQNRRPGRLTMVPIHLPSLSAARALINPLFRLLLSTSIDLTTPGRLFYAIYSTNHPYFSLLCSGGGCSRQLGRCLFCWTVYSGIFEHNQCAPASFLSYAHY